MLKIPPDQTFVLQIVLFVVLWLVLKRWWFEPALRVLHERRKRSEGAVGEARQLQAEADRLRREHAAALEQTRREAQREMQEIVREAEAEQKRIVGEATATAEGLLAEARSRVADEIATARRDLHGQVQDIARAVAAKVLGRAV